MKQPPWVNQAIVAGKKYHVKNQSRLVHNLINLCALSGILILFAGIIWTGGVLPFYYFIPLAIVGLGFCLHSLYILVAHEACHGLFLVFSDAKRNLFWNRLFGWMAAVPVGLNYKKFFEVGHNMHHRNPVTPQDPDNCNPKTGKDLQKRLAMVLFIPGYVQWMGSTTAKGVDFDCPQGEKNSIYWQGILRLGIFWGTVLFLSFFAGFYSHYLFIAVFFSFQIVGALRLLASSLQHGAPIGTEKNPFFRSMTCRFPFEKFLEPFNFNYHFDHHLCDFIPWYLLPKYHRDLLQIVPREIHPFFFIEDPLKQMAGKREGIPMSLRHLLEAEVTVR